MHFDQTMAVAKNVMLAKAAYEQCLREREGPIVWLRNGCRIVLEFIPGS